MRVKTNCSIDAGPSGSSAWYMTKAIQDLGHELVDGYEADLVLNIDGMPHVDRLEGAKYFFWDTDSFMHDPNETTLAFDKVFIAGAPEDLAKYPKGTVFVPHAVDLEYHYPRTDKKEVDIVMIGNMGSMYYERNKLVKNLSEHFTVYQDTAEPGDDYANKMSLGKLILNRTLGERNIPMRFFEGMAIGTLLENYNDNLDEFATEGLHYIGYTDENIVDKVKYYLAHDEERENIAKEGRSHVILNHTYQDRAKVILSYV